MNHPLFLYEEIMDLRNRIEEIAREELESSSHFLVGVEGGEESKKVLVVIDGDDGVSIDVCSALSRKISYLLEEEGIESGPYRLEVSSPGIDRPLTMMRQYPQHIGRKLKIEMEDGSTLKGELLEVMDEGVRIEARVKKTKEEHVISFDEMKKTKVLISFN
jgi:ribosome maturation factor RimP